uniref:ABC transporter permease n=1 Tax=candidate division WOR-3 bacterium TaxID=2052148 RepID=A0A7C4UB42_UNCW3
MKFLFLFALKNITRQKRRTILTSSVIAIAIIFFIIITSLLKGFYDVSFENELNFNTSHMKIRSIKYDEDKPFEIDNYMKNYRYVIERIKNFNFIKGFTEIISFNGEIDNSINTRFVIIMGVNYKTIDSVFVFKDFIIEGSFDKEGIIVGKDIAKDMNIDTGSSVFLTFRRKDMIESIEFIVSGIISSPNPLVNRNYVYMDIEKAKDILGVDAITEIAIKTDDYNRCDKYAEIIGREIKDVKVFNWVILAKDFLQMAQAKAKGNGFLIFFIAIIGFVGVVNTTMISVYEKRREIGTLKTLGMREKDIVLLFLIECFLIGLIGVLTGLIFGSILNLYFVLKGIDLVSKTGFEDINVGYRVLGIVKSRWDTPLITIASLLSILFTTIAGYIPARKGAKMEPAESLRVIQ